MSTVDWVFVVVSVVAAAVLSVVAVFVFSSFPPQEENRKTKAMQRLDKIFNCFTV